MTVLCVGAGLHRADSGAGRHRRGGRTPLPCAGCAHAGHTPQRHDRVRVPSHHAQLAVHALLPRADFVVVATPGTSETAALIGAPELELMRCVPTALHPPAVAPEASGAPGGRRPSLPTAASFARSSSAVLINVSRGSTVDWAALSVALRAESGAGIAACYTDVAPTEPLPADDPLWGVPNLVRAVPATRPAVACRGLFRPLLEIDPASSNSQLATQTLSVCCYAVWDG
jgi:hypothetical protein